MRGGRQWLRIGDGAAHVFVTRLAQKDLTEHNLVSALAWGPRLASLRRCRRSPDAGVRRPAEGLTPGLRRSRGRVRP